MMKKVLLAIAGLTIAAAASAQHVIIIQQQHRFQQPSVYIQENPAATRMYPWGHAGQQQVPVYRQPHVGHYVPQHTVIIHPNAGATMMHPAPRQRHWR